MDAKRKREKELASNTTQKRDECEEREKKKSKKEPNGGASSNKENCSFLGNFRVEEECEDEEGKQFPAATQQLQPTSILLSSFSPHSSLKRPFPEEFYEATQIHCPTKRAHIDSTHHTDVSESYLLLLSDEVLLIIVSYVGVHGLGNLACVATRFRDIVATDDLWRFAFMDDYRNWLSCIEIVDRFD